MEHQALNRRWAAVIAAGGEAPSELQEVTGELSKGLVSFNGIRSVELVARAAIEAGCDPVVVASDMDHRFEGARFVSAGATNVSTSANAMAATDKESVLFLPSDLPRIKVDQVRHFLDAVEKRASGDVWFAAGLCPESAIREAHPHAEFTYLKLKEGKFASGGLYAASRKGFLRAKAIIERASQDRKSQMRLAYQFGLANALRYLSGGMSIANAEMSAQRVLGGKCVIVPDCHPDTTLDFDTIEDYKYLQSLLK